MTNRDELVAWWDDSWTNGSWSAPWAKALEDLTAKEAAWSPAVGRHSIWQIVEHMMFWQECAASKLAGAAKLGAEEVVRRNFPAPSEVTEAAWKKTRDRFAASHQKVREALLNPAYDISNLRNAFPHDHYHMGQIMYLRAMLGKKAIE